MATPEWLRVKPLLSPTGQLTQTVTVYIGNGDQVTVISEAGGFSATGSFDAYTNPARVTVGLLPNQLNHLEVQAHVRRVVGGGGCVYGDYTLSTVVDERGQPLEVLQYSGTIYLPFLARPR